MKVGEKAKLLIRSDYGYGDSAMGANIPANSNLVFDVELLGFEEKEKQKWEVGSVNCEKVLCSPFPITMHSYLLSGSRIMVDVARRTYGKGNQTERTGYK